MKIIVLSLCVAVMLTGCGIKPSKVDPPTGVKKDTFPAVYPDPNTDPKPKQDQ